jgi:PHD/YefM family antitoxin component YafN of YafNO toxin-antitoxin module
MNSLPAQEIKRRGVAALDEGLKEGPLYIIKNNRPQYVVLSEERYRELIESEDEAHIARIKAALEDVEAGKVKRFESAAMLLDSLEKDDNQCSS